MYVPILTSLTAGWRLMIVLRKRKDYIDLEQSVNSSNELLSSLASYLSTFQHDLSDVSGQISDLQLRSSDIEGQLKGRKVCPHS